jgi:CRISPR-associated protein Cmr1
MKTQELTLQFHTPAFLGDAQQSGRWRTPPFKAQLRQWWRVAYAMQKNAVCVDEMRKQEGRLFGHAWLKNDLEAGNKVAARKSKVLIRISDWSPGTLKDWPNSDTPVNHPNVQRPVGAQLYMGYGPLTYAQRATMLKANAAIQANENVKLSIAYPAEEAALIEAALQLMHLYGTVGGRSRNAWGSYSLAGLNSASQFNWDRNLNSCLDLKLA